MVSITKSEVKRAVVQKLDLGKLPVVILPLQEYEDMLEDLEMAHSKTYRQAIQKSREEVKKGKVYTFAQIKKKLGIK